MSFSMLCKIKFGLEISLESSPRPIGLGASPDWQSIFPVSLPVSTDVDRFIPMSLHVPADVDH